MMFVLSEGSGGAKQMALVIPAQGDCDPSGLSVLCCAAAGCEPTAFLRHSGFCLHNCLPSRQSHICMCMKYLTYINLCVNGNACTRGRKQAALLCS